MTNADNGAWGVAAVGEQRHRLLEFEECPGAEAARLGAEEDPTQFRSLSSKYLYSNVKPSLRL